MGEKGFLMVLRGLFSFFVFFALYSVVLVFSYFGMVFLSTGYLLIDSG